ncbi:hypothetical protein [uncultured Marixanthomonas sp.]|uniref:hypothetical protein n=1 Tax=uncultured Marixanthomonas sp. TaxID=757245 RepID=UPI0030D9488F|tara:strand:+ start:42935 stop:43639 length:705 start_codon:yes stop_codon:yes gene_type:complete
MYKNLIISAFEEVRNKTGKRRDYPRARVLSDYIQEETKEPYGDRSLVTKYQTAKKGEPVEMPDFVIEGLCKYLGYDDMKSWKASTLTKERAEPMDTKKRAWKVTVSIVLIVGLLGILAWQYLTRERWMEWKDPVYVEADFDAEKLSNGILKIYKQERIDNFKRIEADCNTTFFNPDGTPKIFYGKNKRGNYQWFTDLAKHPETGKSLKPITPYMINKYICPKNGNKTPYRKIKQ